MLKRLNKINNIYWKIFKNKLSTQSNKYLDNFQVKN